jgi:Arc/MetJ-type ribon-helix-helix transcriptional regulator
MIASYVAAGLRLTVGEPKGEPISFERTPPSGSTGVRDVRSTMAFAIAVAGAEQIQSKGHDSERMALTRLLAALPSNRSRVTRVGPPGGRRPISARMQPGSCIRTSISRRITLHPAETNACIPFWYHVGMTTQIAVRLPDDMVKFIDHLVETGRGSSRATIITRALERERRHEMAVHDAAIYGASGDDSDMVDLVQYLSGHPVDPDQ